MTDITEEAALCPAGSSGSTRAWPHPENLQLLRSHHCVRKTHHTKRAPVRAHLCNFTTERFQFMVGIVTNSFPHTDMLPLQPLFSLPTAPAPPAPLSGHILVSTRPGHARQSTTCHFPGHLLPDPSLGLLQPLREHRASPGPAQPST